MRSNALLGIYTLFAWEEVETRARMDPVFVISYEAGGTVVSIQEGREIQP